MSHDAEKIIPLKIQHVTRKCRGNTTQRRYNGGVQRSSKIEIAIESRRRAIVALPGMARALPGSSRKSGAPRKVKFPNEVNPGMYPALSSSCGWLEQFHRMDRARGGCCTKGKADLVDTLRRPARAVQPSGSEISKCYLYSLNCHRSFIARLLLIGKTV
jgi:hypothetical protein